MAVSQTSWLISFPAPKPARLRLFCFPYAGGGASAYSSWARTLAPQGIEVCAVQFPGRENRLAEPAYSSLLELVSAMAEALAPRFDAPFSFFGHSFGALASFELARFLKSHGGPLPRQLVVSGAKAPHLPRTELPLHQLSNVEFLDQVATRYQGIPPEVLAERELVELLLPGLRADFAAFETYQYAEGPPLDLPLLAFGGSHDPLVPVENVDAWRRHTTHAFTCRFFSGNHFFLNSARPALLSELAARL